MQVGAEVLIAFGGGLLALLSPCSALLLPAFFAYAFPSTGRLLLRTLIFYAGLVLVLVPVGIGIGALGTIVLERRAELSLVAGIVLVAIGLYQLAVGGFEVPGAGRLMSKVSGESAATTFAVGAVYGIAGFCAGPILGGVLTIAAASGGALAGGALLAVYAAGMAAPLFVLSLLWDRAGLREQGWLRGREVQIGPFRRHVTIVISSVVFIALGAAFVAFQGSSAFSGVYAAVGAEDLAVQLEGWLTDTLHGHALLASVVLAAVVGWLIVLVIRRERRARSAR